MVKINFRLDAALHARLHRRALGANLSLSAYIRRTLEQTVDERQRYVFSSQDEILATAIQILSIVATSVGQQSPKALEQGMTEARAILAERGLLGQGEDAR
ncbi:CopG family transcriptional regulator [Sphingobium sp. LB126]|uniref:toxin-antitoxin system HicB family antitoxin n=1 Tax=Sphingobium sp. LB126 TaxID=1983755 RepID=UPI000C20B4E8|nr:toxin-antitoxin system HicB family antitoxin [Sphingobium sp. LB126]PJG47194.1 CopG family transcriptional regulator [Sphingobium sp. LB126]